LSGRDRHASSPLAASEGRAGWAWTAATVAALALIVAASAWARMPGFIQGGFASHDVAGILYNGMVLDRGGLPYVDTVELKAPASFYLARLLAGPEARDIARFQIAANGWALASLLAVAGLAWRLWGRLGALAAAGLYAAHDAHLDSMDANYVTWANLPQILAVWLAVEAGRTRGRYRPTLWMCAGAAAGFAALAKRPAGIVFVVVIAIALLAGAGASEARARWRDPALAVLGAGLAHLPFALQYLAAGQLRAFIDGYLLSKWGLRYVGAREVGLVEFVREGALASAHFLAAPLVLALFVLGWALGRTLAGRRRSPDDEASSAARPGPRPRADELRAIAWIGLWLLATLIAASVGARFYKGYFLAVAAPACVLAAAPIGLLGRRCRLHWALRGPALALALALVARALLQLEHTRIDRARPHDRGGRIIATHLLANTAPDDTIWVWGWHLWDVYPLTGRMSASPIYKSLGILSQPNDDTWRRPATKLRFVDSPYAAALVADLDAARPAYVVFGSTVPHRDHEALHALLRAHYRRDRRVRIGRVQFWRRQD